MGMNDMIQFFRQMSGKLGPTVYAGFQKPTTPQQHSFLRQLQKEIKNTDHLACPLEQLPVVVFDLETTGFYPEKGDRIISIGAVKLMGNKIIEDDDSSFYSLVHSDQPLRPEIAQLTNITNEDLAAAPPASDVLLRFFKFVQDRILIAHHSSHEKAFMQKATWDLWRLRFEHRIVDTSLLIQLDLDSPSPLSLDEACKQCNIEISNRHHALGDAMLTAKVWNYHTVKAKEMGCKTLLDVYTCLAKQQ